MQNKKQYKQSFLYKGKEFQYRIQSASLRKFERETGKRCDREIIKSDKGTITLLYYCTCWKGSFVSLEKFLQDYKTGRVNFRPGAREYGSLGIYKLFMKKIQEFKLQGEL